MCAAPIIGFGAVVWFLVEVYRAGLRHVQGWNRDDLSQALGLAAPVGCTGLLVHSVFNFNLQIPANAYMFYFLCAVSFYVRCQPRARSCSRAAPPYSDITVSDLVPKGRGRGQRRSS